MIIINIAQDYTKTPGGRFIKDGPYSGEDFREKQLKPKFLESLEKKEKMKVILDGGYGYGSSFLEESFGGLARELKAQELREIEIVSEEEPQLTEDIQSYIDDALKARGC